MTSSSELTDELLYHGDLNQALQRLMQRGFMDRNGERVSGMREILEKLPGSAGAKCLIATTWAAPTRTSPSACATSSTRSAPGIENLVQEAQESGDQRRSEITDEVAPERRMALDLLPPDLAGQVQSLQEYEWTSSEAREAFDQLLEELRSQLMQSYFNQMSSSMSDMSPESMQRMKDMFNELNQMLETRASGGDTDRMFEEFMDRYGDMFPGNPQNLDELLEQMARQMAAMQQLLNSMSPEQRAQLQQLAESLMEDMDLRWQVDRLGANLRQAFPQAGWERSATTSAVRIHWVSPRPPRDEPAGRHGPARADDVDRVEPGRAGGGRHRAGVRTARSRRRPFTGAAGQAGEAAGRRWPHRPARGPARDSRRAG